VGRGAFGGQGGAPFGGQGGPGAAPGGQGGPGGGGFGGLLNAGTPSDELVALLRQDSQAYTWVAATVGSNTAAGYQLASGQPVMAIGGFNGTDPAPTLAQFQRYVSQGKIHYFIPGGRMGGGAFGSGQGSSTASQIVSWVERNFSSTTVGGTTVYDLSSPSSGTQAA